jgi:hypothetical protein
MFWDVENIDEDSRSAEARGANSRALMVAALARWTYVLMRM